MPAYSRYLESTGQILSVFTCPPDYVSLQLDTGEAALEGEGDQATQYVVDGEFADRPASPATCDKSTVAADGVEEVTLGNLEADWTIRAATRNGTIYFGPFSGSDLAITFSAPGTYELRVMHWPSQDAIFTVVAS